MGGRPRKEVGAISPTAERVRLLLDRVFGGNQTTMSEAIGIAQPVISRVLSGQQQPGRKFLEALAAHPEVNPTWVFSGGGDPLLTERAPSTSAGWPVPVAAVPLPGPPRDHADLLTGQIEHVAGHLYSDTAYIVLAESAWPIGDTPGEHVRRGDRILLDADSSRWTKNLRLLDGKLCAVRDHLPSGTLIELRRLTCHVDHGGRKVELRHYHSRPPVPDQVSHPQPPALEKSPDKNPDSDRGPRFIQPDPDGPVGSLQGDAEIATVKAFDPVAINDIVAVAVELFRRL